MKVAPLVLPCFPPHSVEGTFVWPWYVLSLGVQALELAATETGWEPILMVMVCKLPLGQLTDTRTTALLTDTVCGMEIPSYGHFVSRFDGVTRADGQIARR